MKQKKFKLIIPGALALLILIYACSKSYLKVPAQGGLAQATLASKAGVEGLLIGAYSMLDGIGAAGTSGTPGLIDGSGGIWEVSADNWIYGSVAGGDDHKGSDPGDQPDIVPIQSYSENAANGFFDDKWITLYDAINRCNLVLQTMALVKDGSMSPADTVEVRAETQFLRGLYHFEAKKMWNNVPYIDESVSYANGNYHIANTTSIWPNIEADFSYAVANLPGTQSSVGRVNVWAAKAFLAKAYMFEQKFSQAQPILLDIIQNGTTSLGVKYALLPRYGDNFDAAFKNSSESVFAQQSSVDPNSGGANGNAGDVLNFPYGGPSSCCGFYQPSFDLANSFKVDVNGIPLLDGSYNNVDLVNDYLLPAAPGSGPDWFVPDAAAVDPRIDYSLGRRAVPYLDWGNDPGAPWVRNQPSAGPYLPIKFIVRQSEQGKLSTLYGGWATNQSTADNYCYIRFPHILLWYAECAAQTNDVPTAMTYVNMVRARAQNTASWVANAAGPYAPYAANYKIGLYTAATFNTQAYALSAIYFENKLEFSSEGHRFFDLTRWGISATALAAYIKEESTVNHVSPNLSWPAYGSVAAGTSNAIIAAGNANPNIPAGSFGTYLLLRGASFNAATQGYYPVPQAQIDASVTGGKSTLTQNPGF